MIDINNNSKIVRVLFDTVDDYENTLKTRDEVVKYVTANPKPFLYLHSAISSGAAISLIKSDYCVVVAEHEDYYHLNVSILKEPV